jgi:hypothetical protein
VPERGPTRDRAPGAEALGVSRPSTCRLEGLDHARSGSRTPCRPPRAVRASRASRDPGSRPQIR